MPSISIPGAAANLAFTDGSISLGAAPTAGQVLTLTGGVITGGAGGGSTSARTTSSGTDTIVSGDADGTVVYGANCTVTITSGLDTGTRVVIGSSAAVTLTWSVSGGESISEASTALISSAAVTLVKTSSTAWRVLQGSVASGWVLVRSLSFNGVTPAVSMSVPDSVTGNNYTVTLSTATGWTSSGGGIRYQPATAGCNVDTDLDALLGATWQNAGVLMCWDVTISTLSGSAVAIVALVGAATDVYTMFRATNWETFVGASGGAAAAITGTSQTVLAMEPCATGGVFYCAETVGALPAALTALSQATYARNSATVPLTSLDIRLAFDEPGGSTLDATVMGLRVYARYGL